MDFVNNPDEEIEALSSTDLKRIAVVDQSKFNVQANNMDSVRSIRLTSYSPNQLIYESNSSTSNLAVFSEIYYPKGWKAFIDDEPVDIARANFVLRALEVPAGNHNIEFRFEPLVYFTGNKITMVGNVLVLLILLGTLGIELRNTIIPSEKVEGE